MLSALQGSDLHDNNSKLDDGAVSPIQLWCLSQYQVNVKSWWDPKNLGPEGVTWGPFMLIEVGLEVEGLRMAGDNDDGRKLQGVNFPGLEISGSIYDG